MVAAGRGSTGCAGHARSPPASGLWARRQRQWFPVKGLAREPPFRRRAGRDAGPSARYPRSSMGLLDFLRARPSAEQPKDTPGPKGGSGRAHTNGFLEFEELNQDLTHPACHEIFDKMYRTDGDVRQVIALTSNPIIAGTWAVDPFGGQEASKADQAIAEQVRWALWDYMRPNLIGHLIEFLPLLFRSGFSPGEIVWSMVEYPGSPEESTLKIPAKRILAPKTIQVRLPRSVQRWFQDDDGHLTGIEQYLAAWRTSSGPGASTDLANHDWRRGDPRTVTTGGGSSGINTVTIAAKDLVYYRIGAEGDNWEGQSLLRPAYKHWFYKDRIERLDAIAQEREAMGIPVLYSPPSASPDQLNEMEDALKNLRTNDVGYIMIPGMKAGAGAPDGTGWLFEIMGYDRSGSGRDPGPSLEYHTQKIAAAFIAEFMRLGHGGSGARATAQVQADPFQMSVEALVTQVEQVLNDAIVAPFVAYNFAEIKNPPRLRMSLVDSTSLSQLADFVLKLTQVGALLPDQELEDFLRARADLPPANAQAVRDRADDEEMVRRMIVGGNVEQTPAEEAGAAASNAADPFGSNAKVGKHKNGKPAGSPQRKSGAPAGRPGAGKGEPRGAAKTLDDLSAYPSALFADVVDLDIIGQTLDDTVSRMEMACERHIYAYKDQTDKLSDVILSELEDVYGQGREHVCTELGLALDGTLTLDRGGIDRSGDLAKRAEIAAESILSQMRHAHMLEDLNSGDPARAQAASETVGKRAARKVGQGHGSDAYQQGRHDMALDASDAVLGAAYSCVLDKNSCGTCRIADDGQVRAMDDPIRLDRRPPNHRCDSTASGANLCRCFEIYLPLHAQDVTLDIMLEDVPVVVGSVPPMIQQIAANLIAQRGMDAHRATLVALQRVRQWARGGGRVSPKTQADAAAAMAAWKATAVD